MKYDAEALYLGFKVNDEMRGERNIEKHLWDGDAIEIFIDLQPDKNIDRVDYTEDGYQIIFGMPTNKFPEIAYFDVRNGISLKDIKNDPNYKMEGVIVKTEGQEGGYDLEIKIPWKYFEGFKPVTDATIGFDIAIDDGDEKEGRAYQIIWAGEKNNSSNRTNLGRLFFR